MRSSAERIVTGVAALLVALALVSCAGTPAGGLSIDGAWVRSAMGSDNPTAAYMVIRNGTGEDEVLLRASTDAAERIEIHRTMADESGMHGMQPVESIHVPARGESTLEPGGLHLMLFGLTEDLEPGDLVTLRLEFENAGTREVVADVRAP